MTYSIARYFLALIALSQCTFISFGQNHIPNPGFEVQTECPEPLFSNLVAEPWQNANEGSTDHFHTCAPPQWCGVPDNLFGWQQPHSGNAYGGGWSVGENDLQYREYLMTPLTQPLIAGKMYHLSFYISLADEHYCGIVPYGAYLVQSPPPFEPDEFVIDVSPQYEHNGGYLDDYDNWMLMEGCILAHGGEAWIIFGNFNNWWDSPLDPTCIQPGWNEAYYFLDDVGLYPVEPDEEFEEDLGLFVGCFEVTVDPEIPGVFYWSDGTIGPTFTTNESGIYSFSVVDSCRLGTGTFEVVILGDPVELGLPDVQVCAGDTYTITLNEDYGDYTWSDGTTGPTIDITDPGEYSVTLDDGCLVSTDEIEVEFVDPIPEDPLGDDAHICNGEALELTFDDIIGNFVWQDGSINDTYIISSAGTYSVTISNACGQETDAITVIEVVEPEVQLGPDTMLCEGSTIEIQLDPAQGDYVWQDGNNDPHYIISTPGTYTVFVSNVCGSQDDEIVVSGIPALHTDLGNDITICPAQLPLQLDATAAGTPTYLWSDNSTQPQLLVANEGSYSVIISNLCFTVVDTINITVTNDPPQVMLPADVVLCPTESITISNAGSTGSYTWQDQSTGDSLIVTTPGTYSLTVTNICGTGSDSIEVDYIPMPQAPDLGPDFTLCTGEVFTLHAGSGYASYVWQDMSTTDSLIISGPGVYYVQVADQCTTAIDTVVVMINNNPPDVDLPTQVEFCEGESVILASNISGVDFLWSNGNQTASIEVASAGTYVLTVSSLCGTDQDSVVVIDLGPQPFVELGGDIDLCEGEQVIITPVLTNVATWSWYDGTNAPDITITTGNEVSIQAINACGTVYDTMQVTLLPAIPSLSLGNDTAICPGNAVMLAINIPDVDITWSDGTQGNSLLVNQAGSYHATISNPCGQAADTIDVAMLPDAPTVDLGVDHLWCAGDIIVFDPGVINADYLWQDGSSGTMFTAASPGTIILQVSNSCGVDTDTVLITLNPNGPQVDLGPDVTGCVGDEVTIEAGVAGVLYEWQDGSTSSSFTTASSGTLILTISNNCGADTDTVEVDLSGTGPAVQLGEDTTICDGTTLTLSAVVETGTTVSWQDGSTTTNYAVTTAGTYSIVATNACGVERDSIEVAIAFPPSPFSLGPDTTLCLGESIVLTVPNSGDAVLWYDGSTEQSVIASEGHVYTVQLSNQCGSQTDAMELFVIDDVPQIDLEDNINRCPEEVLTLDVTQPFPVTYAWSTGSDEPSITIVTPGVYAITIFNECFTVHDQVVVTEDDCDAHIFIPNVFSPNGDGINDVFTISFSENIDVIGIEGGIYDRWGELLVAIDHVPFEWKGDFRGEPMNPGVFAYKVKVRYNLRGMMREEVLVGDVTIVR